VREDALEDLGGAVLDDGVDDGGVLADLDLDELAVGLLCRLRDLVEERLMGLAAATGCIEFEEEQGRVVGCSLSSDGR